MRKELNLDRTIGEISRRLKDHISSNGSAHLPVSADLAGFMTPELLSKFNELFTYRAGLPDNTDILTLEPGYYKGYKLLNHPAQPSKPTTWFSEIEVTQSTESGGRKMFKLYDSVSGLSYWRTTDLTGNPSSGTGFWIKNVSEVVLWSGWSDFSKQTTLAYSVDNFSDVYVKFGTSAGNVGRAYGDSKSVMINTINNDNTGIGINSYEAHLVFNKDSAIIEGNTQMIIGASKNNQPGIIQEANGDISIARIVGVK